MQNQIISEVIRRTDVVWHTEFVLNNKLNGLRRPTKTY